LYPKLINKFGWLSNQFLNAPGTGFALITDRRTEEARKTFELVFIDDRNPRTEIEELQDDTG
jgi:hypothetical protein